MQRHEILGNFANFFGMGFSFRDIYIFLHLCGCLVLHCFLEARVGAVKVFHFAEVINEWFLNERIIETRVRI